MQKYATFNFAHQHISLRFKFVAYLATFWTVKKKYANAYINPGLNYNTIICLYMNYIESSKWTFAI